MAGNSKLTNMNLNTNKAGMEGLDVTKINEIIAKASEGSKFYQHKQKCQMRLNEKISAMKLEKSKFTSEQIAKADSEMAEEGWKMDSLRNLTHTIVHVDMDMFYAAVEMRDDPSLRDVPMAVGGTGMLSTSNYAARKFGVRAAMPGFIGLKLCPKLKIVPPNFSKYKAVSKVVQKIFEGYDPNFSPMSLDEAYLDITHFLDLHEEDYCSGELSPAENVVHEIRSKIEEETSLTASAGIAPNCLLAKVCSDLNKPNGQYYLPPDIEQIKSFVEKLSIRKVSGIGGVTEQLLNSLGVETCQDMWDQKGLIKLLFSPSSAHYFLRVSLGLGSTHVEPSTSEDRKSISCETTFSATSDKSKLLSVIDELCEELAEDMSRKNIYGKIFTLKYKTSDFKVQTRAQTLLTACQSAQIMKNTAHKILRHEFDNAGCEPLTLRLLGARMSGLCGKESQKQTTVTELFAKVSSKPNGQENMDEVHNNVDILATDDQDMFSENSSDGFQEQDDPRPELLCPVCNDKYFQSEAELNSHLDLCLNKGVVQSLVQESHSTTSVGHSNSTNKRKISQPSKKNNKKIMKTTNTIDRYFNRS